MGNTERNHCHKLHREDHPHIHGEYRVVMTFDAQMGGSPPHTWGIRRSLPPLHRLMRITPTYMGNTRLDSHVLARVKDHPHIHGEYRLNWVLIRQTRGSPPHTWGIRSQTRFCGRLFRITPTYMGNTRLVLLCITVIKDHPHIHGEYCVKTAQS